MNTLSTLLPHRRALLTWGAASAWGLAAPSARAHGELGPVDPPRAAPPLELTLHDGRRTRLPMLLQNRVTAMQLMFTSCSSTCPIQGAVFAALQAQVIGRLASAQLLSLTIDPLGDDAKALAKWRAKFGATEAWFAAAPPLAHGDTMMNFVGGRATNRATSTQATTGGDRHNAQVFLFDTRGRLAYRCAEFASASDIGRAMLELSKQV